MDQRVAVGDMIEFKVRKASFSQVVGSLKREINELRHDLWVTGEPLTGFRMEM